MNNRLLVRIFGPNSKFVQEPIAFGLSLFLVVIWSGWFVVSRWGVTNALTPADMILLRYVIGTICALPFFLLWKNEKIAWKPLLALVVSYGVPYLLLLFYGFKTTPVANAGILMYGTLPIINGFLAFVLLKGTISKHKWIAIILLAIANGCMFVSGISNASLNWGWGLIFLGAISIGIHMTVYRQHPISYHVLIPMMAICNFVLFLPLLFFLEINLFNAPMVEIVSQGFYQGVINQVLILYLIAYAVPRLGSVTTSVLYGFIPATTAIMGWIFLNEALVLLEMIGIFGCTLGIIMFGRSK